MRSKNRWKLISQEQRRTISFHFERREEMNPDLLHIVQGGVAPHYSEGKTIVHHLHQRVREMGNGMLDKAP